ncbi:MAG: hypothetical protein EAY75_10485 [Bacteroidetes bacterium]|nr:MAG: hypothetical protein EAY75_10485 [Bacteroidota bacterium]
MKGLGGRRLFFYNSVNRVDEVCGVWGLKKTGWLNVWARCALCQEDFRNLEAAAPNKNRHSEKRAAVFIHAETPQMRNAVGF